MSEQSKNDRLTDTPFLEKAGPLNPPSSATRRQFLKTSSLLAASAGVGLSAKAQAVHTGGTDVLKVGLIGCGGRGTGAAINALQADENVQLVAMADAFSDRVEQSLEALKEEPKTAGKIDVPQERQFAGFDAYKELLACGVDVVILATPPHFRPVQLKAAIDAGKHIFCEKPVAVDAPGVRSVLATCREAKEKGLSVVSGLCLRYNPGHQEIVNRIHNGEIGEIGTLFADDYRGEIWIKARQPDWTDMHTQMRNWYYYTWLSGDFNVEQHIHYLDMCAWIKGSYPVQAIGMGGRQVRTDEKFGNIFDHHSVIYEYEDGSRFVSNTRQQDNVKSQIGCTVQGSKGIARMFSSKVSIEGGGTKWRYRSEDKSHYDIEHDQLFAGIRSGNPLNDGEYMAHSTMLAIMGRMATYTGQVITWDQAINSQEDLTPEQYAWGPAPEVKIALPGVTEFV